MARINARTNSGKYKTIKVNLVNDIVCSLAKVRAG